MVSLKDIPTAVDWERRNALKKSVRGASSQSAWCVAVLRTWHPRNPGAPEPPSPQYALPNTQRPASAGRWGGPVMNGDSRT